MFIKDLALAVFQVSVLLGILIPSVFFAFRNKGVPFKPGYSWKNVWTITGISWLFAITSVLIYIGIVKL